MRHQVRVRIEAGEDVTVLFPHLDRVRLIEVDFPRFRDGRGFSTARMLREAGYTGELKATGDVLVDLIFFMRRCGFDAFAPDVPLDAADAESVYGNRHQLKPGLKRLSAQLLGEGGRDNALTRIALNLLHLERQFQRRPAAMAVLQRREIGRGDAERDERPDPDEGSARARDLAAGNLCRVGGVEVGDVLVEGHHQGLVADGVGRGKQAGAADDNLIHRESFGVCAMAAKIQTIVCANHTPVAAEKSRPRAAKRVIITR